VEKNFAWDHAMNWIRITIFAALVTLVSVELQAQDGKGKRGKRTENDQTRRMLQGRGQDIMRLVKRLDANGDGALSKEEIPERMVKRLSRMDMDGNGSIDIAEIQRLAERMDRTGSNQSRTKGKGSKGNRSNLETPDKARPGRMKGDANKGDDGSKPKRAGKRRDVTGLIKRLDQNGDGQISRDEAGKAPQQLQKAFSRIDANSDEIIDKAEIQQLKALMERRASGMQRDRGSDGQAKPGIKPKHPGKLKDKSSDA